MDRIRRWSTAALPYVDPTATHGPLYGAYLRLLGTRSMARLSRTGVWRNSVWRIDPHLLRISGGRIALGMVLPTGLLETRGARTGRLRRSAVMYFHDGERVTIIASKAGAPEHPSWLHNLRADPDVRFGGRPFRAEIVEGEAARARLWELADCVFPGYATYRLDTRRLGRTIPIVQLVPR